MSPQASIIVRLELTALIETATAVAALAGLSRSNGKATSDTASAVKANRNPRRTP